MVDQKPVVDHAQVQTELSIALRYVSNNVIKGCTENEEALFATCISGDSPKFQALLNDELFLGTAVQRKRRQFGATTSEIINLLPMLSVDAQTTRLIPATAEKHKLSRKDLISFCTVCDAINCGNFDVLKSSLVPFLKASAIGRIGLGIRWMKCRSVSL
jgi:hypothetical protein